MTKRNNVVEVAVSMFQGSFLGDNRKLPDNNVQMECVISWEVYHPALGDPV